MGVFVIIPCFLALRDFREVRVRRVNDATLRKTHSSHVALVDSRNVRHCKRVPENYFLPDLMTSDITHYADIMHSRFERLEMTFIQVLDIVLEEFHLYSKLTIALYETRNLSMPTAMLFYDTFTSWDRSAYYPEYTYEVNESFWMAPEDNQTPMYATNTTLDLKCRQTNRNSLVCSLERQRMSIRSAMMSDNNQLHLTVNPKQLFEVKFHEGGVESLVVQLPGITDVALNTIRLIASQLNIGIGLKPEHTDKTFVAKERSVHGECDTLFKVKGAETVENLDNLPNQTMVLWIDSHAMRAKAQGVTVEKTRNTRKCDRSNRYVINRNGRILNVNITSSFQRMKIADPQIFESYTVVKGKLLFLYNTKYLILSQTTRMRLENIAFAQGLPTWFPDGGKASIFYNDKIENNFID